MNSYDCIMILFRNPGLRKNTTSHQRWTLHDKDRTGNQTPVVRWKSTAICPNRKPAEDKKTKQTRKPTQYERHWRQQFEHEATTQRCTRRTSLEPQWNAQKQYSTDTTELESELGQIWSQIRSDIGKCPSTCLAWREKQAASGREKEPKPTCKYGAKVTWRRTRREGTGVSQSSKWTKEVPGWPRKP